MSIAGLLEISMASTLRSMRPRANMPTPSASWLAGPNWVNAWMTGWSATTCACRRNLWSRPPMTALPHKRLTAKARAGSSNSRPSSTGSRQIIILRRSRTSARISFRRGWWDLDWVNARERITAMPSAFCVVGLSCAAIWPAAQIGWKASRNTRRTSPAKSKFTRPKKWKNCWLRPMIQSFRLSSSKRSQDCGTPRPRVSIGWTLNSLPAAKVSSRSMRVTAKCAFAGCPRFCRTSKNGCPTCGKTKARFATMPTPRSSF